MECSLVDQNTAAGPLELAASLCPNQTVLSDAKLTELVDLAFRVSLKREEGRYPSFQLFAPLRNADEPMPAAASAQNCIWQFPRKNSIVCIP